MKAAEDAMNMLPKFRQGIDQYKLNLQRGLTSGMVRSISECAEGIKCMKQYYPDIFTSKKPDAVLSWYGVHSRIQDFVSHVPIRDLSAWIEKYGKNMSDSLRDGVIAFVGTPLVSLFEYLENDHMTHCVPDNVSSGLGTRPVDYVYFNGTRTSKRTNQTLDGAEKIMKGKEAYKEILSYFTTTSYTPGKCWSLNYNYYYTFNSLTLFWLAESLQWIFEISARDVITADYTIIMPRSRVIMSCMTAVHDFQG